MATVNFVAVFIVLNLFSDTYAFVSPYSQRVCRIKDTCVRITQCQPYMVLFDSLKRPLNTNSLVFLRHQECGFDAGLPMVCCLTPSGVPQNPHETNLNPASAVQTTPKTTVSKNNYNWNFALPTDNRETNAGEHVKNKREDEVRRKMEAINQSFMDDFFAKRITDNTKNTDLIDPK